MTTTPAAPAAQPGNTVDPFRSYNFELIIDKVSGGHFTQVSGLGVKIERVAYREAGLNQVVRMIPGRVVNSPVRLEAGLTSSTELWDWLMTAASGEVDRRLVQIVLRDAAGTSEVMRWTLTNAWASEWHGAVLDAMSHELAIETLVIAHEGLRRVTRGSAGPA